MHIPYKIFDMEVLPHWWCLCYKDLDTQEENCITSDDRHYLEDINAFKFKTCLVGFNIKGYDLRILNAILGGLTPEDVYEVSKSIIYDYPHIYNDYKFWNKFAFTDLYDDWLKGSLKEFESNVGMSILESAIPFDKEVLTDADKRELIYYCYHDVEATCRLWEERASYIQSKLMLSEMYNISVTTALRSTNAKLCALVLGARYIEREEDLKFVIPERVKAYIHDNLPENIIRMFNIMDDKDKKVNLFGNKVTFGIGGIHSTIDEDVLAISDDKYKLSNRDVRSYYPNLMMNFNYLSRNVARPGLYKEIYETRARLKGEMKAELKAHGKTDRYYLLDAQQNALKLILNTTYGASKNQYNALYDPYNASSLCYLGQLLLASLSNKLYNEIPGLKVIQTNTDGVLVKYERCYEDQVNAITHEWELLTDFVLEEDVIDKFYQRDVNNYIEVTDNEKNPYKLKGRWCNQAEYSNYTNLNAPITHLAILDYYTKGVPIETTIRSCTDPIQFCFTTKTGFSYDKTYYKVSNELTSINKVNRVYASKDRHSGTIVKYKVIDKDEYLKDMDDTKREKAYAKIHKFEETFRIPFGRLDKASEIPKHCHAMNDNLYIPDDLDYDWYIEFAKNKLQELVIV